LDAIVQPNKDYEWDVNAAVTRPRYGNIRDLAEEQYFDANINEDYTIGEEMDTTITNTGLPSHEGINGLINGIDTSLTLIPKASSQATLANSENSNTDSDTDAKKDTDIKTVDVTNQGEKTNTNDKIDQ
jgi:hypothetical protein